MQILSFFNSITRNQMSFELNAIFSVIQETFFKNIILKIFAAMWTYIVVDFIEPNRQMFLILLIVYWLDFITGIRKALSASSFSSARFFRGALKLGVYIALIFLWHSVDQAAWTGSIFLNAMFIFCLATDASSVIENLNDLWYKTPAPFQRFLKSYWQKVRRDKLWQIDPSSAEIFEDYAADISEMTKLYVPKVKCEWLQKLLKIKFEHRWIFCNRVQAMEIIDLDIFRQKILLLAKETVKDIETSRQKQAIDDELIQFFNKIHQPKRARFFAMIEKVSEAETNSSQFELRKISILKEISLLNYQWLNECLQIEDCPHSEK